MASLTVLAPLCVTSSVHRCNGIENAGVVARPASVFFAGESRFLHGLRSGSRTGPVALPKVSATTVPLTANPPFSSSGGDNSGVKTELFVSFCYVHVIICFVFVEIYEYVRSFVNVMELG